MEWKVNFFPLESESWHWCTFKSGALSGQPTNPVWQTWYSTHSSSWRFVLELRRLVRSFVFVRTFWLHRSEPASLSLFLFIFLFVQASRSVGVLILFALIIFCFTFQRGPFLFASKVITFLSESLSFLFRLRLFVRSSCNQFAMATWNVLYDFIIETHLTQWSISSSNRLDSSIEHCFALCSSLASSFDRTFLLNTLRTIIRRSNQTRYHPIPARFRPIRSLLSWSRIVF